ncbi:class II glutamine amidotransferase [Aurantimonas marina]|uniref:class II glutamine amidotransferase n=1 Tax=Aurantimonas marina TaxID=2780508 RepID=UPI0019D065EC|nr:class II glutamine amidotransferase [Aurantimonas marina]
MCRLLAYAGPPIFLDRLLVEPRASLISQSLAAREAKTIVNGDGCGIGWYGERPEAGVYRGISPAWSDANLVSLCRQIRSPLFLAHVRSATYGEVSTANCHPFADGRHLFMHNGQIGGYERLRRGIDALIPDALYPRRRGTSDSEAIFLAALGCGLDDDPVAAIAATLSTIATTVRATGETAPLRFAAVHSDGETFWAYRWANDGLPPSLYWRREGDGIVVASEPCDADTGNWTIVPPASVLVARRDGAPRIVPFELAVAARAAA